VIPPKLAPNKVVIVPIYTEENKEKVLTAARHIEKSLSKFDVIVDDRDEYRPGFKFNEWELKGIPLRIELGAKELEKEEVMLFRRDNGKKASVKFKDLVAQIEMALEAMHKSMFEKSKKMFEDTIVKADTLEKVKKAIANKKIAIVPLCKNMGCEDMLKYETGGAKTLFIAPEKIKDEKCVICKKKADYFVYTGKSY
jgi:prolyl-tRNA synthetase